MRRLALALALALALVLAAAWGANQGPAVSAQSAEDPPPQQCPGMDYCQDVVGPDPGADPPAAGPAEVPSGNEGPVCTTQPFDAAVAGGDYGAGLPNAAGPQPSPEAVLMYTECQGEDVGRVWWWQPGEPETPPQMTAAELAGRARVRLEGNLPPPDVSTSPPRGVAAILGFPSFVAVDNWTDAFTDRECDPNYPSFCIEVTAVPAALSWWPGEPGAEPVACAGSGTVFDPAGGAVEDQAAPPACAYAYRTRTGVWGRPAEWPGVVTVTWTLTYTSPAGDGTLPDVVKAGALPRAVAEVQTVVERAG